MSIISQGVYAEILDLYPSYATINANIGQTFTYSILVNNTASFNMQNIAFSATDSVIFSYSPTITFTPSSINLTSGQSQNATLSILTQNSTTAGQYLIWITASNGTYSKYSLFLLNLIKNSASPKVLSHSPTGKITISSIALTITTDKIATCRYSTTSGVQYDYMNSFSTTDDTTHIKSFTNLADGLHHYYIRCKDSYGNVGEEYDSSFRVDTPPTATIILSDSSPIKAGTVKITLITSEEVYPAPSFSLSYDGIVYNPIILIGSDTTWMGYIIILGSLGNAIGSFKFSAKDLTGNTGTEIKSGGIFIVDTVKPYLIANIEAVGEEGSIQLKWYYTEDVEHFNIYRSASPNVGYMDLYKTATNKYEMQDILVESGKTYYYRVSAVDEAGNEADLSKEVHATVLLGNASTISSSPAKLSPELVGDVDRIISLVNQAVNEADDVSFNIKLKPQKEQKIFSDLKLAQKIENAKSELNNLKRDLEGFKLQDSTKIELDKKLERADLQIRLIKKTIPENLIISEEKTIQQKIENSDVERLLLEIYPELAEKERARHIEKNEKVLSNINSINLYASLISIGYRDGTQEEITFIETTVQASSELKNASLVMIIPKIAAQSMKEIEVKTQNYEILKEDPILSFPADTNRIVYVINKKINLADVNEIKLIPLLDLETKSPSSAPITGFFVNIKDMGLKNFDVIAITIGIVLIIGLLLYIFIIKKSKFSLTRSNKQSPIFTSLNNLISKADKAVDDNKVELATELYGEIVSSYSLEGLSDKEKIGVYQKIGDLCVRIDSYHLDKELTKAETSLSENKTKEALCLLYNIRVIYERLPKEYQSKFYERYDNFCRRVTKI